MSAAWPFSFSCFSSFSAFVLHSECFLSDLLSFIKNFSSVFNLLIYSLTCLFLMTAFFHLRMCLVIFLIQNLLILFIYLFYFFNMFLFLPFKSFIILNLFHSLFGIVLLFPLLFMKCGINWSLKLLDCSLCNF